MEFYWAQVDGRLMAVSEREDGTLRGRAWASAGVIPATEIIPGDAVIVRCRPPLCERLSVPGRVFTELARGRSAGFPDNTVGHCDA